MTTLGKLFNVENTKLNCSELVVMKKTKRLNCKEVISINTIDSMICVFRD